MSSISRRDFIKGVVAGAASVAGYGVLTACSNQATAAAVPGTAAAAKLFTPGKYTSVQSTPYAKVEVCCTYTESALSEVSYNVIETSDSDYFTPFADKMKDYCDRITAAGTAEGVDGVSGASLCSKAIKDGVSACTLQALGVSAQEAVVSVLNPQDENFKSFDSDLSAVFSPITLGNMTLANRVVKSAGSSPWKDANKNNIPVGTELFTEMAANGVALNILAGGAIRNCDILPDGLENDADVKAAMETAQGIVDSVHAAGGKIGYQMCFGGLAPSVPDSVINETPVEDLDAYIERVGISAERGKAVGFDCIEIKGASADALNGFLSRRINKREDEYGPQSIENRTRLFCRMIQKIKEVNGADFPVGALINGVEENDAYIGENELFITIEEAAEIAKALVAAGADWIQLRVGATGQEMNIWAPDVQHIVKNANGLTGYGTMFDYSTHWEGMVDGSHSGFASFLPMVKAIKKVVDVPVGCAAYMDLRVGPDYLNAAIENGDLDIIFMNRPLNCDPQLVRKMQEGKREAVRPCMKCMHCHDNQGSSNRFPATCRMNASSFHSLTDVMPEGAQPVPAETSRNIMVIGAGPAGLEAAKVSAERGHKVTIYDKDTQIGGLMRFAQGVKGDHEHFGDYFTYMEYQLKENGVDVKLGTEVDEALVKSENPDAVIVAVGGNRVSKLSGTAKVPVLSPEAAFGSDKLGETVVILGASVQAVDFAAYLTTLGKKTVLVHGSSYADVDLGQSGWFRRYVLPYLQANGTRIWNNASVNGVSDDGVAITTDAGVSKTIACDSVVEFYDMVPNTALADALTAAGIETYAVGDCNAPYNIQKAVLSGNLTARAI